MTGLTLWAFRAAGDPLSLLGSDLASCGIEVQGSERASDAIAHAHGERAVQLQLRTVTQRARTTMLATPWVQGLVGEVLANFYAGTAIRIWACRCAARLLKGDPGVVRDLTYLVDMRRMRWTGLVEPRTWEAVLQEHQPLLDHPRVLGIAPVRTLIDCDKPPVRLAADIAHQVLQALRWEADRGPYEAELAWQEEQLLELLAEARAAAPTAGVAR